MINLHILPWRSSQNALYLTSSVSPTVIQNGKTHEFKSHRACLGDEFLSCRVCLGDEFIANWVRFGDEFISWVVLVITQRVLVMSLYYTWCLGDEFIS